MKPSPDAEDGWRRAPLSAFVNRVTYGFTNPMPTTESGPFMITAKDIMDGRIDYSGARRTSKEAYVKRLTDKSRPQLGDVLLTKDGSIGRVAVCDRSEVCINQSVATMRPNGNITSRFLAYLLQAPSYQAKMEADSDGSTIKHIYITRVDKMLIDVPSVPVQRAIAEVLGALDDKITANTRLAGTVDDLAQAFFLARSRAITFSGVTFADICTIGGGGTPSTSVSAYWDGRIPWATPTDVTALTGPYLSSTSRMLTDLGVANCASPLYPVGSILMTSRATIGAFALAQVPVAVNQGFIVVNPSDPKLRYWIFHEMRHRVEEFKAFANGATFLELSRGRFRQLPVRVPNETIARDFDAQAGALHAGASAAIEENRRLAILRDTLLPHLMSGRLRVKDAEAIAEEAL